MSREKYVPPTLSGGQTPGPFDLHAPQQQQQQQQHNQTANSFAGSDFAGGSGGGGGGSAPSLKPVTYLCGDCNARVPLKRGEPIRCKDCGHRVLYKERTNRKVQFEAR